MILLKAPCVPRYIVPCTQRHHASAVGLVQCFPNLVAMIVDEGAMRRDTFSMGVFTSV